MDSQFKEPFGENGMNKSKDCKHTYVREDYHRYSATVCTKCGHEKDKVRDPAR